MDKLKNILKSDTPTGNESDASRPTGSSRAISGQGSHFPSKDEASTGTTVTGTDPQTRGPADISAAPASSTAAALTGGPEQGGTSHVSTAPASSALPSTQTTEPTAVRTSDTLESTGGPTSYTVSGADFPQNQGATAGTGSAAIGETSTYSSSHLSHGDPTSSVVDPASSDPLTYKKPESGAHGTAAGVGSGAAAAAASLAFTQGEERKRETMSGAENPYRASALDPRVDGLSKDSTTSDRGSGVGTATGAGAASAYSGSRSHDDVVVPSTLTTTVDPTNRSAEYSASTETKGLDASTDAAPSLPHLEEDQNRQSMVGRVLGAVGLGGIAGSLMGTGSDSSAVADTTEQPTTTTGLSSYTAPTQQGAPTSHHRKESIPTTAYPSGTFDSPRAINPPLGGAGSPVVHGDEHTGQQGHTGRNIATGVAAGGAAAGAAEAGSHALAHHATTVGDNTSSDVTTGAHTGGVSGSGAAPSTGAGRLDTEQTAYEPSTVSAAAPTMSSTAASTTTATGGTESTARDSAIGAGVGAAALGTGAYGAHEYREKHMSDQEIEAAKRHHVGEAAATEDMNRQTTRDRELEKQRKDQEKAAAKEEKHHQKELEKEEKHHQKEIEKEEKHRQKEAEKEQARLAKQREEEEEDRRNREQREKLAAAAGVGGAAGAATTGEEDRSQDKEKRPSFFKRIFKRRKNKDTGEEEEYESNEEEPTQTTDAAQRYGDRLVGTGTTTYEQQAEGAPKPSYEHLQKDEPSTLASSEGAGTGTQTTDAAQRYGDRLVGTGTTTYEQQAEGAPKPSYEHLQKDEPSTLASSEGASTGAHGPTSTDAITGLPYDASKDPEAAQRLSEHTHGEGIGHFDKKDAAAAAAAGTAAAGTTAAATEHGHDSSRDTYGTTTAPTTLESTGTTSQQPTQAVTGLPATSNTASKDIAPSTAESSGTTTQQHPSAVTGVPASSTATGEPHVNTDFTLGEIVEKPSKKSVSDDPNFQEPNINTNFTLGEMQESSSGGLADKIKDALHIGGHKQE